MSASNQAALIYTFMHFDVSNENHVGLIRDTNTLVIHSVKNQKEILFYPHKISLFPLPLFLFPVTYVYSMYTH